MLDTKDLVAIGRAAARLGVTQTDIAVIVGTAGLMGRTRLMSPVQDYARRGWKAEKAKMREERRNARD